MEAGPILRKLTVSLGSCPKANDGLQVSGWQIAHKRLRESWLHWQWEVGQHPATALAPPLGRKTLYMESPASAAATSRCGNNMVKDGWRLPGLSVGCRFITRDTHASAT